MTVVYGAVSLVVQAVLLSELSVLFRKNDVVIGVLLFSWLAGSGLGSAVYRRLPRGGRTGRSLAAVMLFCLPLFLLAIVCVARMIAGYLLLRSLPDLGLSSLIAFMATAPAGFMSGMAFAALAADGTVGGAFFLESLGAFAGGAGYTLAVAGRIDAIVVSCAMAAVGAAFAFAGGRLEPRRRLATAVLVSSIGAIAFVPLTGWLVRATRTAQFKGAFLRDFTTTRYGTIATVVAGGQESVYYDGEPLYSPESIDYEETVMLPALAGSRARSVLVLGFSPPPLLREMSLVAPERIAAVFQDPALGSVVLRGLPSGTPGPGPEMHFTDPCRWKEKTAGRFDLVMLNRDLPGSIAENRYFSREFLAGLRRALDSGGILSVSVPYEEGRMDDHALRALGIIRNTLQAVYPHVRTLAAGRFFFFASDAEISLDQGTVRHRLKALRTRSGQVNGGYIAHYFAPDRMARYDSLLASGGGKVNGVYDMGLYLDNLKYRLAADLGDRWPIVALILAAVVLAAGPRAVRTAASDPHAGFLAAAGFAAMTGEIQLLAWFQGASGYVYRAYAILAAMFMLGLAAGGGYALLATARPALARRMFDFSLPAWLASVFVLFSLDPASWGGPKTVLLAGSMVNYLGGFCLGAVFNHAVRRLEEAGVDAATIAVRLYSADLLGAATAALVAPVALIPLLGHRPVTAAVGLGFAAVALATRKARHAA